MNDRLIDIIEDHESVVQFVEHLCASLDRGMGAPPIVPMLHDSLLSDQLGRVCEFINRARGSGVEWRG